MPIALGDDLRRRVLVAWEGGEGSLRELAVRFCVSYAWTKKIRQQQRRSGKAEREPQCRHGFASRVDEAARQQLRAWVREQPDRTQAELCDLLRRESKIVVSPGRVGQVLRALGMRRKKNAARLRAGSRRRAATAG